MDALDRHALFAHLGRLFEGTSCPEEITVGVEQEFFLCRLDGQACDHKQSQRFLSSFSGRGAKCLEEDDPRIGRYVAYADVFHEGRRVRFKYDHHPHLMEIELPPRRTLGEMYSLLGFAMDLAVGQASELMLLAHFTPFLPEPVDDKAIWSEHSLCVALREYRRRINVARPDVLNDPRILNFSAYIAATHLHLGGIGWSALPRLIDGLYRVEPDIVPFTWRAIGDFQPDWPSKRWKGYLGCLGHLPLVAFPELPDWSLDNWFEALCQMPLADTADNHRGGGIDAQNVMSLFRAKRDVSLIKPRTYGTIEFRADPCLPTADAVAAVCALRLGMAVEILHGQVPARGFCEARQAWSSEICRGDGEPKDEVLEIAAAGLGRRGCREERLLDFGRREAHASCTSR